jgi:predicted AlkP superfamily phosphohydrolase/phosphomutase
MALFRKKKDRVCVIGLDGVPVGLLKRLAAEGVMPFTAELIGKGRLRPMKASLPEISAVSWTDFMTGRDAGGHGVFGFTDLKPGSYSLRFPNFRDVKAPVFWDELGRRGRRSIVINQPATYPARPVEGVLVSGFVALELEKSVYPPSLLPRLKRSGYKTDIDIPACRRDRNLVPAELASAADGLEKLALSLFEEDWDYFEVVVTGTDRLHHYLWNALEDVSSPHHAAFLDYYRRVDGFIRRLVSGFERLSPGLEGLFLLSDHGFTSIVREVNLNSWLAENGYLDYRTPEPTSLEDIAPAARAFALDPNRVYINLEGRFPGGGVKENEREKLAAEIAEGLSKLSFEGRPAVRRVFRSSEVYAGPHAAEGPDLIVLSEPGFDMKGSVKKKEVFSRTDLEGMHTWDDAFFWSAAEIPGDMAIKDAAGVIMKSLERPSTAM